MNEHSEQAKVIQFDPHSLPISVTAGAVDHIRGQLAKTKGRALRFGVTESGCNGYMYELDYIDTPSGEDLEFEVADGVTVYVAKSHLALVQGTEIDYVTEGLNSQLKFKNPNAQSECGCGESFSLVESAPHVGPSES